MKTTNTILICLLTLMSLSMQAKSYLVQPSDNINDIAKKLQPGDSLVLTNGVWKDTQFSVSKVGTKENPITITVETKGKVTLEGQSCIRFSGEYINISGLVFINGYTPRSAVIESRTSSDKVANNCIVSECVIYNFNNPDKAFRDHWVGLYGKNNRVEYCYFEGKNNQGTTFVVWPDGESGNNNQHHIYRNYFGKRPPLGGNGGETMRIGTSHVSKEVSGTIVEENYFERCDGEVESISIKSCENKIINNTFFECKATLTLRHGDRNEVSGNFIDGNNVPNTGGIRIVNEGHKVYNNFLYRLTGKEFYSALAIMNGIDGTPLNGYHQVKDVVITNNTIVDCVTPLAIGVGKGGRDRDAKPINTVVANNVIVCPNANQTVYEYDQCDGIELKNNLMVSANGLEKGKGRIASNPLPFTWGENIQAIVANVKAETYPFVKTGITGCTPTGAIRIGAFQGCQVAPLATSKTAGPQWFVSQLKDEKPVAVTGKVVSVAVGDDNLYNAIRKAKSGDILELSEGVYVNTKRASITTNITIRAKETAKTKPVIKVNQSGTTPSFFELKAEARLTLQGVELDGGGKTKTGAKYGIITSKDFPREFTLIIDNCLIRDFQPVEGSGAFFQSYLGAFADSIVVKNSVMRDCYRGFALGAQKEEDGTYNAEFVVFDNTVFENFTQYVLDYRRLGMDESTVGGTLSVTNCIFSNVFSAEGKYCIQQKGIKNISISNSMFLDTDAKSPITLNLPTHYFGYNVVAGCGAMRKSAAIVENVQDKSPKFRKGTYDLDEKSPYHTAGKNGSAIGLK